MAFQTTGTFLFRVMEMMIPASIFLCQVATVTKRITVYKHLSTV
jgi:hypothetical protein